MGGKDGSKRKEAEDTWFLFNPFFPLTPCSPLLGLRMEKQWGVEILKDGGKIFANSQNMCDRCSMVDKEWNIR